MAFTVVKTIGTTGDFATVQAWDDAAPASLTTAEQSAAGTFAVAEFIQGETLTFVGSGATGTFLDTDSTGVGTGTYVSYGITAGNPAAADVVTGGTSGATCTLSSSTPMNTGVLWEGQCQNEEFSSASTVWSATGNTTSATAYMHLTTVAGASFRDHADVLTNPLRIDTTKGATLTNTAGGGTCLSISLHYTRISNLQFRCTGTNGRALSMGGTAAYMDNCIGEATYTAAASFAFGFSNPGPTIRNSVFIQRAPYAVRFLHTSTSTTGAMYNCTLVAPFDLAGAPTNFITSTSGTLTLQNCALFSGGGSFSDGNATINCTTCISNFSGIANVATADFQQEFENAGNANSDFRLSQSALSIDAGTTDATNAATDIKGTARPVGGAYDIGAWESAFLVTGRHQSNIRHTRSGRAQDAASKRKCRKRRHCK